MDSCPLCHKYLDDGETLQLHYILCPANPENQGRLSDRRKDSSLLVRFRWAKVEPCVDRIVHLITSETDPVALHWSDTEGLYESAQTGVPLGKYACQLAVGGEIIPIDEFEVTENSDTIYIIPTEEDDEIPEEIEGGGQGGIIDDDDDPVAELLASTSIRGSNDLGKGEQPGTSSQQDSGTSGNNLLPEGSKTEGKSNTFELSPLYKELLHHQVIHGEPSWVPNSQDQSPTASDQELDELMRRTGAEEGPPHLTSQPANPEERHLKSPIPVRPNGNQEERTLPDALPGSQREGTRDREAGTRGIKRPGDHHGNGNQSPAASSSFSGTSSKRTSEHSSAIQSPDITSDAANDSDGSNALQEQSLEEDRSETEELPQPYDGTFLTRDLPHDVPGNTHEERSGTASEHSELEDVPTSSLVRRPSENETTGPIPLGSNESPVRASPHSETQGRVPIRGGSVPGSRGSSEAAVHSLDEVPSGSGIEGSTYQSVTSPPFTGGLRDPSTSLDEHRRSSTVRSPPASSPAGSVHSSVQKRSLEDFGNLPLSGHDRTPPASSPSGSAHSSIRKRSLEDPVGNLLLGRDRTPPASSPGGSFHSLPHQPRRPDEFVHSPVGSAHSSTRSSRGQSPVTSRGSQGEHAAHSGVTSPAAISSIHSSARNTPRGSSPRLPRRSLEEIFPSRLPQGGDLGLRSSPASSYEPRESPRSSAPRTPVDSHPESRSPKPAFSQERIGEQSPRSSLHSRGSPVLSHGSRESPSRSLRDSFDNNRDYRSFLTQEPLRDQRSRSTEKPRDDGHLSYEPKHKGMVPGNYIPSSSSAFTPMNGDDRLDVNHNPKTDTLRQEDQLLFQESRDRRLYFEAEIRRLRELNDDLKQQLLNVETVAALSERDNQKSTELEVVVASLKDTLREKDEELKLVRERCEELEENNQKLKDEQESLKTVNQLTYEDMNKVNSDLKAKITDMQRKTYGTPVRTYAHADQILNKTLREKVTQLESDKRELKQKYSKVKLELEQTKNEKILSDFRLKRAKSETDLGDKFDRFTSYSKPDIDKDIYGLSLTKTSSGLGSSRYSWSDNYDSAYKVGSNTTRDSELTNGVSSVLPSRDTYSRRDERVTQYVTDTPLYSTSHQRRLRSSIDDDVDVISDPSERDYDHRAAHSRERHRTLSSESSNSSLLEYEYGANTRIPHQQSTYSSRDTRVEMREPGKERRVRPHSCHADTELYSDRQTANGDAFHCRSSSHSPSLPMDYRAASRARDYRSSSRPLGSGLKSRTGEYSALPGRSGTSSFSSTRPFSTTTGYPKVSSSKPFYPASAKDIELDMRILVTRTCGTTGLGEVRYVGSLPGREGTYIGVELDNRDGRHDGSFNGTQFFKCKPNRGIFVKLNKVIMCYPK